MRKILRISTLAIIVIIFLCFILGGMYLYSSKWENGLFYKPLSIIKTNRKIVALTFDDGPSEKRTMLLLDLLDKYNIKATFFMLGQNIKQYPETAKRVIEKGHLIGNHSYDHSKLVFKSFKFIKNQIELTDQLINNLGQEHSICFRPPYSAKFIILPSIIYSNNKILVTGTYDPPSEYKKPFNSERVTKEIVENIKPGSIVYLHDGKDEENEEFISAVENVITKLTSLGYIFVRIDYEE
jgi:peptidoglycan/xylan/chitin deacetylase (PgdA/CDA1 family)